MILHKINSIILCVFIFRGVIFILELYSKLFEPNKLIGKFKPMGEMPSAQTIMRRTISIAWPRVVESFLIALVGFIDNIMVSSLGTYAISAVGLTTQPKFVGYAVFMALNVAMSALVARRRGEGDRDSANRILKQVLIISIILQVIVLSIMTIFARPLMEIVGAQSDTIEYATEYFQIIMGLSFFNLTSMTINAAQRGIGNTKIAMKTNIISNVVNVFFNYLLINGHFGFPALGVRGAAIATVIGSVFGFVISLMSICKKDGYLYIHHERGIKFDKRTMHSVLDLTSSTFVEQIFMRAGFLMFSMVVAHLGTTAYAAHQIGMNCMSLSFAFGDGFNVAAVSLIGMSLGEKRRDLAAMYGGACQRFGMTVSAIMFVFFFTCGRAIFRAFSSDPEILNYGSIITKVLAVRVLLQIRQVITAGCLKGAGDTKFVAFVAFVSITIIRPLGAWVFCYPLGMGLVGAWIGTLIDQTVRCVLNSARFATGKWAKIEI